MTLFISTIALVGLAIIAIVIQRQLFKHVATNYVALAIGIIAALISPINHLIATFHSEIFMGMIVAPLLFYDGISTRFNKVARNLKVIISLTVFMAVICAVVAGFGMAITGLVALPLAFVLAAISTPTDATASEAVSHDLVMPEVDGNYLQLESLFNDASGIILLNMAILWYVNGYINYAQTLMDFIYSALGGVLFGFIIGGLIILIRQGLIRSHLNLANDSVTESNMAPSKVIYLATPFIIYFGAEWVHVSGIIAVVCAGVLHNAEAERSNLLNPRLIYDSQSLVGLCRDILNGIVFVVLGVMMVRITNNNNMVGQPRVWIALGIIMYIANVAVRYLYSRFIQRLSSHDALIFAFGGVHGAVTFALAFMVAETAVKRTDFNLVLMAEAVLIVLSLVVPTILFRFILQRKPNDRLVIKKTRMIREKMIQHAIEKINQIYLPDELRQIILYDLQTQMRNTSFKHFWRAFQRSLRQPELTKEQVNTLDMAYRLAFQEEREYLSTVSQQEIQYLNILTNLYSEILMAEMVVLNH